MPTVHLEKRRVADYQGFAGTDTPGALRALAAPLTGLRILHVNSGPLAARVSETIATLVGLQRDLGLVADWWRPVPRHPDLWSAVYRGMAGGRVRWGAAESSRWRTTVHEAGLDLPGGYDLTVVHDPELLPLAEIVQPARVRPRWLWHCHLDLQCAHPVLWAGARDAAALYDAALFPSGEMVPEELPIASWFPARPAVDPLCARNVPLDGWLRTFILERLGLDPARPIVGQFSPMDERHAPVAALGAYSIARQSIPGLQAVLVDSSPGNGGRNAELDRVRDAWGNDPSVHILTAEGGLSPMEVNVLQQSVSVGLQMAVPASFGWGLAECQLKGKPVVVGTAGMLGAQAGHGAAGFVVEGAAGAGRAIVELLRQPDLATQLGRNGRERILGEYTVIGLAHDYLRALRTVASRPATPPDLPARTFGSPAASLPRSR